MASKTTEAVAREPNTGILEQTNVGDPFTMKGFGILHSDFVGIVREDNRGLVQQQTVYEEAENTCTANATTMMRPREPAHVPGAVAVPGADESQHDLLSTTDPAMEKVTNNVFVDSTVQVEARLVDPEGDNQSLLAQLNRTQANLDRAQRAMANAPQAELIVNSHKKRNIIIAGFIFLLLCLGGVGATLGVLRPWEHTTTAESTTETPTTEPTSTWEPSAPPTPAPTAAPTPQQPLEDLIVSVSSDKGAAMGTPFTPQSDAYNWLYHNQKLDDYSDRRRIQRYALAASYHSMGGSNWKETS